ncbi:hypothetical protein [Escherichia coli]|uniref:hypothetical protein n=1 Tax=Escherichia coli TaxID=562 RepID=UPI000E059A5A
MRAKIYQLSLWIFISFLAIYAFIIYKGSYIGVALHQIAWIIIIASGLIAREGANKRGNSSRLTQSFHFFMFEPIFSPVNALNQPI